MNAVIYLVPTVLDEAATFTIPPYVLEAVKDCQVIFAENERTARRFLKALSRDIVIDAYEWYAIHKAEEEQLHIFRQKVKEGKHIAIISEAGCPGIADPGQLLVQAAQELKATVKPLVGPSSILLALMASGMNGQHFEFLGYLPIDNGERTKLLLATEAASLKDKCTKIFIETPYRNNVLVETMLKICRPSTRLCIAMNITAADERIQTRSIAEWRKDKPDLHKIPAIFLLQA